MQRMLLICLLIVVAATGCTTPATPGDVSPQATLTPTPPASEAPPQATFTPAPTKPAIDILQQATTFTPVISGSLTLKNKLLSRVMLDEAYLYWTVNEQEDTIFRLPLNGGDSETYITSKFQGGNIDVFPLTRTGDWFVYFDQDNSGEDADWELRSKNVRDGSEKIVLAGRGAQVSAFDLFISASGEWLAWSRLIPNTQGACQESVLGLSNLRTDEQIELDRACIDQYMWTLVGLSGQTLVAEQDFPEAKGSGHNVYLFEDARSKQYKALTDGSNASMPYISSPWIVWKDAPRFQTGNNVSLYNISDKTRRAVIAPGYSPPDPKLKEQWLHWISDDGITAQDNIYLYDLKREQTWKIHPQKEGYLDAIAIYGPWIAWGIISELAGGDSVIEWGQLP